MSLILLDAMGGDFAPKNPIEGAILALKDKNFNSDIGLVGDEKLINESLNNLNVDQDLLKRIEIFHASEVISMHDSPTKAIKEKGNSSIVVGLKLHKQKVGDAFISAGNTGAMAAGSLLILGRIKGIYRPAIATFFPTLKGKTLVLDVGATVDCKPFNLMQFAIMGSVYMKIFSGNLNPTVGLLSIGEEPTKGNDATVKAHQLIKQTNINFYGNIEGKDIIKGVVDVAVCDGFVGNVLLKFYESVGDFIRSVILKYLKEPPSDLSTYDYQNYGGAPLLGVDGISIISHGKSSPLAIKNAILVAERMVEEKLNKKIEKEIELFDKDEYKQDAV